MNTNYKNPTKIVISDNNIITIPYLDNKETKAFINAITEVYNIETLDDYKVNKNDTKFKATINIIKKFKPDNEFIKTILDKII
jgi:hypothetical protein